MCGCQEYIIIGSNFIELEKFMYGISSYHGVTAKQIQNNTILWRDIGDDLKSKGKVSLYMENISEKKRNFYT